MSELISCICPTFGRFPHEQHLLNESVESFLRQSYPEKELIILNDCPDQKIVFNHPEILVINSERRYRTLGEKYNAAIAVAQGDFIAPWEDDDISLPPRLRFSRQQLGDADYYNPCGYWYQEDGTFHDSHAIGVSHNCSLFTRRAHNLVGGYDHISGNQDQVHDQKFRETKGLTVVQNKPLDKADWYYVYRFRVSHFHLSSRYPHQEWYDEIGQVDFQRGEYQVQPTWHQDYYTILRKK